MTAQAALQRGDLDDALAKLLDEVRAEPDQPKHRVFLFQLLCVVGDLDRALTHLNVARDLDPDALVMAKAYQEILQCEAFRREVFTGKKAPLIFGEPVAWLAQLVEALRLETEGNREAAQQMRAEAFEQAPETSGVLTVGKEGEEKEVPFEWIADGDTRLGPVLEIIINGRYYWAPFDRIAGVTIDAPEDLRDLVWAPSNFRWSNEGEVVGVIPARYALTEDSDDSALKLSRKTDWIETAEGGYEGVGQRVLVTDAGEYGLLEVRGISFNSDSGAGPSPDAVVGGQ